MSPTTTSRNRGCPPCRYVGLGVFALVFGIPVLLFLVVITYGAILLPLVGLFLLCPILLVHYLLWGKWQKANASGDAVENHMPSG